MSVQIKTFLIFMIMALTIAPSSIEAGKPHSAKNRIFSEKHAPLHRPHPYGGTLVWGVVYKPTIMNPILTSQSVSANLMDLIFDSLIKVNGRGQLIPSLAKSWDIAKDGLEYTFYLREDVLFHDGHPFTANDVKFTYELISNPKWESVWKTDISAIDKWEIIDDYTIRMTLKRPFESILYKLVKSIAPKHLLENKDLRNTEFNYKPIGTGSFKLTHWNRETNELHLEANPDYFDGRPYLNAISIKIYADDTHLLSALMRHEVDLVQFISQEDYLVIKESLGFKTYAIAGSIYYAISYDVKDEVWKDVELRQAIAHGINKKTIIDALPRFTGEESTGPFHPDSPGYNSDVEPFEYNASKAREILMRKKNLEELELRILVDERNEMYNMMVKVIRQQLSEIGVRVSVIFYKNNEELTQEFLAKHKPQAWLRFFLGLGFDPYDAVEYWSPLSSRSNKIWSYQNKEVERLFELLETIEDKNQRSHIYKKIHKIIYEDQPACFLFYPAGYFSVSEKFKNTHEYFSSHMPTYTMKDWYIE